MSLWLVGLNLAFVDLYLYNETADESKKSIKLKCSHSGFTKDFPRKLS